MQLMPMKRDIEKVKEEMQPKDWAPPEYPYGLCLCLTKDILEKLNMDGELPDIGTIVKGGFMGKVTAVRASSDENSDNMTVEIQITDLGIEEDSIDDDKPKVSSSERLYGKNK